MAEIQQEDFYADYIRKLHWTVERVDGVYVYIKSIPFTGGLAKIQRSDTLPSLLHLLPLLKKYNIKSIAIEPSIKINQDMLQSYVNSLRQHIRINTSPFLSTKTILVDLRPSEKEIFFRFSEAKRRAVRRALKQGVSVEESHDINTFINIKNKSAGLFGFITTYGVKQLWETFAPKNAAILLAYDNAVIGGVLLVFVDNRAYYWLAGATRHGKKLFAPSLLVWEALKLSKHRGCRGFDFVGVWDERMPKLNKEWMGFTKFKEGFGGTVQYYPIARLHR